MNRNCFKLVFSAKAGMLVPQAETARSLGKSSGGGHLAGAAATAFLALAAVLCVGEAAGEVPVPSVGNGAIPNFVGFGQAAYQLNGAQAFVNQVGNKSILNWKSFNLSPGSELQFRQVDSLATNNLVPGASFTSLNRIWDANPSVIAGSITQGAGQKANVIMVNTNGIAFMGGSQVNLNSFTASSLDIADRFITESLFPGDRLSQFEGNGGFVKVFEGAKISAGNFGRVMLIAPTVINQGRVDAPDGQVIVAAGSKVYLQASADTNLRGLLVEIDSPAVLDGFDVSNPSAKNGFLDGQPVALTNGALDKLGHATNLGSISAARGNVSMVGHVVNQQGIARATTSVVANGSIYLQAKDRATNSSGAFDSTGSRRGGQVNLGPSSLTEILPEVTDKTGTTDSRLADGAFNPGLEYVSRVDIVGRDIRMAEGALIHVPAGEVSMIAVDAPGTLTSATSIYSGNSPVSELARIHIASGARIDVAGLERVQVAADRNTLEVELRGDELKDSPINRNGPLRGKKAYLDVNQALANANSGVSTLIAKDSLEAYQGRIERTVAERATQGGKLNVHSQGEVIVESGAQIDLSGGSVQYAPGLVKTTLVHAGGKLTELAEANATVRYDGIATRFDVDYGNRWAGETIELPQSLRYDPGYIEGKNAGSVNLFGMAATYLQADIQGRTTIGERQIANGQQPTGARLTLGFGDSTRNSVARGAVQTRDFKTNQDVDISEAMSRLPGGFKFGDALSEDLRKRLSLNSQMIGKDKIALLEVFSNRTVNVQSSVKTSQGGGVALTGSGVKVNANIDAPSGNISVSARNTLNTVPEEFTVLPNPKLEVADGVRLSVQGAWVNDLSAAPKGSDAIAMVHGGRIILSAEAQASGTSLVSRGLVSLGQGAQLDASGGGRLRNDGRLASGNGGEIGLSGFEVTGINKNLQAPGLGKGGKLSLSSAQIQIGGSESNEAGTTSLDADFFKRGGFADFNLTALDKLVVLDGTRIEPRLTGLELKEGAGLMPTGSAVDSIARAVQLEDRFRQPVNLTLAARQKDTGKGEILVGEGAIIAGDSKAKITLEAREKIEIQGAISAPGGSISATLDRTDGLAGTASDVNPIWLGNRALLDVSGKAFTYLDNKGFLQGEVIQGGTVHLNAKSGYVVTQAGARINVSGSPEIRLEEPNEDGKIGRMIGSDAGTLTIFAEQGALLEGRMSAHAGGPTNRGGTFNLTLSKYVAPSPGSAAQPAIGLSLAPSVVPQVDDLQPHLPLPMVDTTRIRLGADALEAAGFDRIALSSRDAIRLEDGLNLGAGRVLPLRELRLDAARIQTSGGDAALKAETLRVGNYEPGRLPVSGDAKGGGTLAISAGHLELAGNLRLEGFSRVDMRAAESISFSGVTAGIERPTGQLASSGDLIFTSGVMAPTTLSDYRIVAPQSSVAFHRTTDLPVQPMSALGKLSIDARDILQDGNLWAPFGQLDFKAAESITFGGGGLTSVAAASASVTPFGKVLNGRNWVYDLDSGNVPAGQLKQSGLPEKSVRIAGKQVALQVGAKVDISGGGDLQAYEFTVGPGGSRDMLADVNTFAVLPGYGGSVAPVDPQESKTFNRLSGDAVYLSGVPGLADGKYTILPAHYALLPGAFAVSPDTSAKGLMPGQAFTRQDGIAVAAGYLTDSRATAPKDARWSGFNVFARDQILVRSELALSRASDFFAGGGNLPQDAGLMSIVSNGVGNNSLKLDGDFRMGSVNGGRGASVDISAMNLALVSGKPKGIDPEATQISVDKLNALGAASLLIGATRSMNGITTALDVKASNVTLANDSGHALSAPEIVLAANDTLTLKAGSMMDAQGVALSPAQYIAPVEGALIRAATGGATIQRTGTTNTASGNLFADAGSLVRSGHSIAVDATRNVAFNSKMEFSADGNAVPGNLTVGAPQINLGDVPLGAQGISYSQSELNKLGLLQSVSLTSYGAIDIYGNAALGGTSAEGKPLLQNLTLQTSTIKGIDNAGKKASFAAKNVLFANASSVAPLEASFGTGELSIAADVLTLGVGKKSIQGFGQINFKSNEMAGIGTGVLKTAAPTVIETARLVGGTDSNQSIDSKSKLAFKPYTADRNLENLADFGANWDLTGSSLDFNTSAVLPSGKFKVTATQGDLTLGPSSQVDVAGRTIKFFDASKPTWAGTVELGSHSGSVVLSQGAIVDVSAAPGGDAGSLIVSSPNGQASIAAGTLLGSVPLDAGKQGAGGRVQVDTMVLADYSALNAALNRGGFDGSRTVRVRQGNVLVADTDTVAAKVISLSADAGKIDIVGHLNASGDSAGRIEIFAKNDVNVLAGAVLEARATATMQEGGDIEIGTRDGALNLAKGSQIKVGGGSAGLGGTVLLRAPRTGNGGGTEVALGSLGSSVDSARSVAIEATSVYKDINTLSATGTSGGSTLSLESIKADNQSFAAHHAQVKERLGKSGDSTFRILSGVEVRSTGDISLGSGTATTDWNLATSKAGGEPGVLTLRAAGNLKINSNLSDGFSNATACTTPTCAATPSPATLQSADSWSYRLIAGADSSAANPLSVSAGTADVTLAAGKLIRTGTGDIRIASGRDVVLADNKAAIYTAGKVSGPVSGFVTPVSILRPVFSQGGGDVSLNALGAINGKPSAQLYSEWLYRQGALDTSTGAYTQQPAWWVRFDQFQQGVGALGGGNVTLRAGGDIKDVSGSTPTQGRMAALTPLIGAEAGSLVVTGGGNLLVEAGKDVLGGQFYAARGELTVKAGGAVAKSDQKVNATAQPLETFLALGDATADVKGRNSVAVSNALNPHLLVQSGGNLVTGIGSTAPTRSLFSTYSAKSSVDLGSLNGDVAIAESPTLTSTYPILQSAEGKRDNQLDLAYLMPSSLAATSFQKDVTLGTPGRGLTMSPADRANLSLLAGNSVMLNTSLSMSDRDPLQLVNPIRPAAVDKSTAQQLLQIPALNVNVEAPKASDHALTPIHQGDTNPAKVYAVTGDVRGFYDPQRENLVGTLNMAKPVRVQAGLDISNLSVLVQHASDGDTSSIISGRDLTISSVGRRDNAKIWINGPGRLEVTTGRDLDLGASGGIVSRGNLDNPNLPERGADLHLVVGVGAKGINYQEAVQGLVKTLEQQGATVKDETLWQARWLTGNDNLIPTDALGAVKAVGTLDAELQRTKVRNLLFAALRVTGRDANVVGGRYAGDFSRAYAAIENIFPGIREKNPDGSFKNYQGSANLFASRVLSALGGNIEFLVPGGDLIVGLSNTPNALVGTRNAAGQLINTDMTKGGVLGMTVVGAGDLGGMARNDILVNQSRMLTVGGGNVLLWSSEGDIDAGKGKKTATAVPPPVTAVDSQGNVSQILQGAVSGSGIGALSSGSGRAGDVDLIAPKGTVNAGDAGIRAGNLNIAAQTVLGADNISVSGTSSGTPVVDTTAVVATASGATSAGSDVSKSTSALTQAASDAAQAAQALALKDAFKPPSIVRVDVLGFGR